MIRGGAVSFDGSCFRHSRLRYATVDEETLGASARVGGRFNPPGEFGAIYVALDRGTAMTELERRIALSGLSAQYFHPRVILRMRAHLSSVLDLTDPRIREENALDLHTITGNDWAPTQEIAREARQAGYIAIRFPSATGAGENLAIFLDTLGPDDRLEVEEVEEISLEP